MIDKRLEKLEGKKNKNYTHFDINKKFKNSQEKLKFYENFLCSKNIMNYSFWPLIRCNIKEKKFILIEDELPENEDCYNVNYKYQQNHFYWEKKKIRPITYASHKDSHIYSYYSFLLWNRYEEVLKEKWLENNIIAYRHVPISDSNDFWKNNIYFAMDTFKDIVDMKDSVVMAFDISWFFDNLDHKILKQELINVLWWDELTKDWYKLFKNLTKFSYIEKDDIDKNNLVVNIWTNLKKIDADKFNLLKKTYKDEWEKLITINSNKLNGNLIWIPQWTPISWMLANIYMLEFDNMLKKYISKLNWQYYRYSDDILLILPINKEEENLKFISETSNYLFEQINNSLKLKLNNKKTEISIFRNWKIFKNVIYDTKNNIYKFKDEKNIQGFQYLGFTFDWNKVLLRNKTLSNYYKKLIESLKRLYHLLDLDEYWLKKYKTNKVLLWKHNRKYLFNWIIKWKEYKKVNNKWVINDECKWQYLWFLSYWYNAYNVFEENFCQEYGIKNWIKKQLAGHRKKYNKYLLKYWIK